MPNIRTGEYVEEASDKEYQNLIDDEYEGILDMCNFDVGEMRPIKIIKGKAYYPEKFMSIKAIGLEEYNKYRKSYKDV